ncbi:MAG: 4-hydroxybenzoyl-CoA reductase, partial [Bacteroidota bacterium]
RQRESIDFPLVNVGIAARLETTAIARNIRIVLGAVASAPARVHEAEHLLEGLELTDNRIVLAGELAASVVNPMPNTAGTVAYRKRMAKVLVERTLRELRGL